MSQFQPTCGRWLTSMAMFGVLCMSCSQAEAQSAKLIAIEEDWIALVKNADSGRVSPQFVNVISPSGSLSNPFGLVELNHSTQPTFAGGGLQVQVRQGDLLLAETTYGTGTMLASNMDRLEYTVALNVTNTGAFVEVSNIRSKSWRSFRQKLIRTRIGDKTMSLTGYTPEFSVSNCGVNCGAQRVSKLAMTAVRYIYSNGTVVTDNTERLAGQYAGSTDVIDISLYASE